MDIVSANGFTIQGGSVLSRAKTAVIVVALASVVSACGVRGTLDRPSASVDGPKPTTTADADSGQGKKASDTPKPHKGFILDGLLE